MSQQLPASLSRRQVLLLGASGKVGRLLRAVWAQESDQPFDLTPVFRSAPDSGTGVVWAPGEPVPALTGVHAVLAFWGVTRGDEAALAQNTTLALAAEQLARALGVGRVVHCSSAAVYAPGAHLTEAHTTAPHGAYGRAKLAMERALQAEADDLRRVILRIGNVAGAESLFGNMRPGRRVFLDRFADRQGPWRSYIAGRELARVLPALVEHGQGVYNVAAPDPVRMQDLAAVAGCPVVWQPAPPQAVQRITLDTARLQALCPLGPETSDPGHLVEGARAGGIWP